ncbi:hypothetical protein GPALN_012331 [Globodera pallida]|uniref:Cytochrome b5 heme-binding domain-containing protein n=1 Tax=Globodera pallida TaxID=36090 RepID=A0A183C751_GLOPA|nr:hypothetical protein GPALN_012331 [Globodera pallida]
MSFTNTITFLLLTMVVLLSLLEQHAHAGTEAERIVVTYKGKSYDVTEFKNKHPGGPKVLEAANGKDVEEYLLGKKGVKLPDRLVQHKHAQVVFDKVLPNFLIKP